MSNQTHRLIRRNFKVMLSQYTLLQYTDIIVYLSYLTNIYQEKVVKPIIEQYNWRKTLWIKSILRVRSLHHATLL